jgi:N utilization substance protein B
MSKARHNARWRAVQAIYQWQLTQDDIKEIEQYFLDEQDMKKTDKEYFSELLGGVANGVSDLDGVIAPLLDRPINELDPVEKAILRMGTYELIHRIDVPYRVVINESVDLAKSFGAEDGFKYVNGILDKLSKTHRKVEVEARRQQAGK